MTQLGQLAKWLLESERTVIFTGAGMSTESGLPDFRSSGGLWKQNRRFEELASTWAFEHVYDEFVEFYRWRVQMLSQHAPHEGHRILARWQQEGRVKALITQNVDGFHSQAGSEALELHGTLRLIRCQRCGREEPSERFLIVGAERCDCGGKMRPGVVLFGEGLPMRALRLAEKASREATLFMVLGSSLMVSPANLMPQWAIARGAKLVIINRDPTPLDDEAALVLRSSIGETLAAVDAALARVP